MARTKCSTYPGGQRLLSELKVLLLGVYLGRRPHDYEVSRERLLNLGEELGTVVWLEAATGCLHK